MPLQMPDIPLSVIRRFARRIAKRFQPDKIILITLAFDPPFALDLIVRTPAHVERGLRKRDSFLCEAIEKGKLLYEAPDRRLGAPAPAFANKP